MVPRPLQDSLARLALALAVLGLLGAAAPPSPPAPADLLAGLQRWLDGTRDLQASFQQELVSGSLGAGVEESGKLWVARPGRMRWDYLEPERKVALVEGDRTTLWLADEQQLYLGDLGESGGLLPVLLAGRRPLGELFRAEAAAPGEPGQDRGWRLRLVPRTSEESFEELTVRLRADDHALEGAEVVDRAGNRVSYRFTALRRNRGIDPARFEFTPPPGTEVVGAR